MEPDLNRDDQLPPDPLLQSGAFIDVSRNAEAKSPTMKTPVAESNPTSVDSSVPTLVTPVSQWRPDALPPHESSERPDWLPQDWKFERRVRASGASAGVVDRYYISPAGTKFRSKTEVLHFLETGSRKKKVIESGSGSTPAKPAKEKADAKEKPDRSVRRKKSKENGKESTVKDFSNLDFDFKNPPQSTTWVPKDESNDEWTPVVENAVVPKTDQSQWSTAFARVTELEQSDGVVL